MKLLNPVLAALALGLCGCSALLDFDCADDADCANLAGGATCVDGACVVGGTGGACSELLVENVCSDVLGVSGATPSERAANFAANRDDYVLISVHPPHGGFAGQAKASIERTVGLALNAINNAGAFTSINGKNLAVLICEDGVSVPERGVQAGLHAVECGAVAMVGTNETDPTLALYKEVARLANVPLISPGAISPAVPDVRDENGTADNDDLLWRVKVPGNVPARAAGELVKSIDQHQRVRVFYREGDKYGEEMYAALRSGLCENGTFCSQAGRVDAFTYPTTNNAIPGAIEDYLAQDAQAGTDLVITLHSNLEGLLQVLVGITDAGVEADVITIEGARSAEGMLAYQAQVGAPVAQALGCRTIGISSGTIGPARGSWDVVLNLAGVGQDELFAPTAAYVDAVFVTAFAIAAAAADNDGAISTTGIINGLRRLSDTGNPDRAVEVHDWASGLSLLTAGRGATIDYVGASGGVDFDPTTNDVTNQRTEVWRYSLGGGDIGEASVFELPASMPLTDDRTGALDLTVRDALMLDYADDPACEAHPFIALVPNPEPADDGT